MSIERIELSRNAGVPFELYEFTYGEGSGDIYTYTDSEKALSFQGADYVPRAIARAAILSKGRQENSEIEVTVPRSSEIAGLFRGVAPRRVVFLRIFGGFLPGNDTPTAWSDDAGTASLLWSGRVIEASPDGGESVLTCDTLGAGMKRPGLTRTYSRECAFPLFGDRCQASRAAATYPAEVATVASRSITISGSAWREPRTRANFVGGALEWVGPYGTETRQIVSYSGETITVDGPITDLAAAASVGVVLGCRRNMAACQTLHNNITKYGGTPFIPLENPVNKNNHT